MSDVSDVLAALDAQVTTGDVVSLAFVALTHEDAAVIAISPLSPGECDRMQDAVCELSRELIPALDS